MSLIFELAERLQSAAAAEGMLLLVVKATLVLLIARLVLAAVPRASAATRHLISTVALVAVAAMPIVTVLAPAWEIAVDRGAVAGPATEPAIGGKTSPGAAAAPQARRTIGVPDSDSFGTAVSIAQVTGVGAEPLTALQRATEVVRASWKGLLVLGFAAVAAAMLLHMLTGMAGVAFVARHAEPIDDDRILMQLDAARGQLGLERDVRLLRSARISVPVVWGIVRPILMLPPDARMWPEERLRVVLLHELAHLKRVDGLTLLATRIAVSLFWFHPLAWSLERAGRSECERACDDLVLAGGTKPSEYADHLLAIARTMPSFDPFRSVTLAMSRKSQLEGRLLSILQPHVARRVFSRRGVALACALAVAVIVPLSAVRIVAEEAKPVPPSGSSITVKPQIEKIENYLLAQLGKFDKRLDRFAKAPETAEEWYEHAYDLYRSDRHAEAAAAFKRAAAGDYAPAKSLYNAACSYALMSDRERALSTLGEAIAAGWDDLDHIAEDSDFDSIRSDPRFAKVVNDRTGEVSTRRVTETVRKYDELRSRPHSARHDDDWFDVGVDLLSLRRLDEAIHAFEQSIAADEKVAAAMYNVACAHSLRGDVSAGMEWLNRAVENGYSSDEKMQHDPDIAALRQHPEFPALVQKAADLEMRGCCKHSWIETRSGWREVADHHRAVTEKYPRSGRAWFNLGYSALQARDYGTARNAFERAIALDYRVGTSSYNIACGFALEGNRDAAFQWLERARAAGFDLHDQAHHDEDLRSLRGDPRWAMVVE